MKVIILHQFYNTPDAGGALRSYYLTTALAEQGIHPVVITSHNGAGIKSVQQDGIELHYLPVTYDNRFGFFKRIYSFLKYVFNTVSYVGQFHNADVCYAISTPLTTGLAALWIKFRYNIPFYFEVGDLWPEAPIQIGFVKNPLLKLFLYKLEKIIYRNAKAVVALSPLIREDIKKKAQGKSVYLIPNMADTEFFQPEVKRFDYLEKFNLHEKFVVSYIGTLGLANGLHYMIECATLTQRLELPIQFLLCGNGATKETLMNRAKNLNLQNISFIPFQNREGVKAVLNVTDAVLVCYEPLQVLETGCPNKLFDGLSAGKLIILNFNGWLKNELEVHHCGIVVNPHNTQDFVDQVQPFMMDSLKLNAYQEAARALAVTKYSRKIISQLFLQLFRDQESVLT